MAGLTPAPLHWLRVVLRARGSSMAQLAEACGRGRSHLSQVLNGKRPGGYTWARIRAAVTPEEWELLKQLEHCAAWNNAHPAPATQGASGKPEEEQAA